MIGFEIAQLSLPQIRQRLDGLKELAVLPVDETGVVVEDDSLAHESAREMRLLLQRMLDVDAKAFLNEMQRLYFHLFAADHEHYRDLLIQAAQKDPVAARDFALEFLTSDDVLFVDDQYTLHDMMDVLELLGAGFLRDEDRGRLRSLLNEPFFRLPSLLARVMKFLGPSLHSGDIMDVRKLFEMDWIPRTDMTWDQIRPVFATLTLPAPLLEAPRPLEQVSEIRVSLQDFEDLRWMAGIESNLTAMQFRLLGCLVARGPQGAGFFVEVSEGQPETAFHRNNFETDGQRYFFLKGLDRLREHVVREAHQSGRWFTEIPEEREWPWAPPLPPDPWPRVLRELPVYWSEFANPTNGSEFEKISHKEIARLDDLAERLDSLTKSAPLPSADRLNDGHHLAKEFLAAWEALLRKILPRLDIVP